MEATQNLKTHLMKTLLIKKLATSYKDCVLLQETDWLNIVTNMKRAMLKQQHASGQLPKMRNLTMSSIAAAIEDSLNELSDDIREDFIILAIKNKGNQNFCNNKQFIYSGYQTPHSGKQNSQQIKCQAKKREDIFKLKL